jgi:hypothetical protein
VATVSEKGDMCTLQEINLSYLIDDNNK